MVEPIFSKDGTEIQRRYYASTAKEYDERHVDDTDEHAMALFILAAMIDHFECRSVLDVGSGTGRAVDFLIRNRPDLHVIGIEPVEELRSIGHGKGISSDQLIAGDATRLEYGDAAFDVVCEFGMLHHTPAPSRVVDEMLRVARRAIFLSDSNNFGQGSFLKRSAKQLLHLMGLWKAFDFLKTGGKGFRISEGDGVSYSYSVFNDYARICRACSNVHVFNTRGTGCCINPYRCADHVALIGIK